MAEIVILIIYFKDSLMISEKHPILTWNISETNSFTFPWWIVKELSFLSCSLKDYNLDKEFLKPFHEYG